MRWRRFASQQQRPRLSRRSRRFPGAPRSRRAPRRRPRHDRAAGRRVFDRRSRSAEFSIRWRHAGAEHAAGVAASRSERRGESIRGRDSRQHRGCVDADIRRFRRALLAAGAHLVQRSRAIRVRVRELGGGSVLLPSRSARVPRYVVLQRPCAARWTGRFRCGLCHRPRDRPSRAEFARHCRPSASGAATRRPGRREPAAGRDGAAGRLLCGSGRTTRIASPRCSSPATWRRAWLQPKPLATIDCNEAPGAVSHPIRSRTAPPSSGNAGYPLACKAVIRRPATLFRNERPNE